MPNSNLKRVRSRNIEYICYDPKNSELGVEFRTGAAYKYFGVPKHVYLGLLSAEDADSYFAQHIKLKFRFSPLHYYL